MQEYDSLHGAWVCVMGEIGRGWGKQVTLIVHYTHAGNLVVIFMNQCPWNYVIVSAGLTDNFLKHIYALMFPVQWLTLHNI